MIVSLVITQPDRPAGRKMELVEPAVKQFAVARGLTVIQPEKIKNNLELRERLEAIAPGRDYCGRLRADHPRLDAVAAPLWMYY